MKTTNWNKKVYFGTDKSDNTRIYISAPTWDCGWYWSFGYLGNSRCHYHLGGYANGRNVNMYDALLLDYELNPKIKENLWLFCELSLTAYTMKQYAELLYIGGSHYTRNPLSDLIKNQSEHDRINNEVLPAIFDKIYELIR